MNHEVGCFERGAIQRCGRRRRKVAHDIGDKMGVGNIRGKLFLIRAQSSSGQARQKDAQEAAASFDQAFKVKNLLRREYGKYWEEAKQLAQN